MKVRDILTEISRRDFLKGMGAAAVGGLTGMAGVKDVKAAANWILVYEFEDGSGSIYLDQANVKRTGSKITVWSRMNFTKPHGTGEALRDQVITLDEWDCDARTRSILSMYAFYKGRSAGNYPTLNAPAEPVIPGSRFDFILDLLCRTVKEPRPEPDLSKMSDEEFKRLTRHMSDEEFDKFIAAPNQ